MADIIQLLPDAVANQIAAGEVIQRPASVIKELVENAVDAGADSIKVIVKDAGKTLIQIIDNGVGMSETDARLSFERHATSKIKSADDLFGIRTKGFRGEALASIASIAHVTLKTRQPSEEIGTEIVLAGSEVESQAPVSSPIGSNFMVKNLFYNVPARRKFLKSNATEFKHILTEYQRIVLTHPDVEFALVHNDSVVSQLPSTNLRQRIIHVMGKHMNQNLNNIDTDTTLIKISGFIGKPENARKTTGEQYFFINQRYMRHPYFHRAVMKAFEGILPSDCYPSYFIYFEAEPQTIDVNIHPTKTEIKFESEQAIFQIITAAIKETLGRSNVVPSIDFETHGVVGIPVLTSKTEFNAPKIEIDHTFNPFDAAKKPKQGGGSYSGARYPKTEPVPQDWEKLYGGKETQVFQSSQPQENQLSFEDNNEGNQESISAGEYLQLKNKYILTSVKSGLMVIDQRKAHVRILFEQYVRNMALNQSASQRCLFPEQIDLSNEDYLMVKEIMDDINSLGFEISDLGSNTIVVNGIPDTTENIAPQQLVEQLIEEFKQTENNVKGKMKERLAVSLARAAAINYGKILTSIEMRHLVDELFACENPNYTPTGKKILGLVNVEEIEKILN